MELPRAELRVLYEDNHLIGVYKPAGLLTQGDRGGDPNLLDVVKGWLAERYHKPGRVFLGLLHRLDRPVSGVMLFAKTSKAAARLSQQFRERSVDKAYLARLEGVIAPADGRLSHFLAHTEGSRSVEVRDQPFGAAKAARLCYETRWSSHRECIVAVQLETGRKHQIRAQLAHVGHPIVGDSLYGSRRSCGRDTRETRETRNAAKQVPLGGAAKQVPLGGAAKQVRLGDTIALCAIRLAFAHPISGAAIALELPKELLPDALRST